MKRETINGILNAYIRDHLSPTATERAMVSDEYEFICGIVGGVCFQSGSYARYTSTTPVNDLDIIWQVPRTALGAELQRKLAQGQDPGEFDPSTILRQQAEKLRAAYAAAGKQVTIKVQSHSIGIYFGSKDDFSIDLVPAVAADRTNEFGDDIYWVPEIARLSHNRRLRMYEAREHIGWMLSDPRGYIEDAHRLNDLNESFRKVSKVARKWRRGCKKENSDFPLKSFHLELVVNDLFKRSPAMNTLDGIEAFFKALPDYLQAPRFRDRANNDRYVDEYVNDLTPKERVEIAARIKAAASNVSAIVGAESEENARELVQKLLTGGTVAIAVAVAAPAIASTSSVSFPPPRNYAATDRN